ncbi:hypothetical protein BXZ70DRAFT_908241 [Cristinia sonorae]|uniref:Uncharacterized protein n=1 Tax=Cristinia sonorae TaxID=1940300 RepID=A0A8K0UKD8_9AGAR|nr:hypothetical protein BXZ70DRAFT_908241 [Cristinia sonorae]
MPIGVGFDDVSSAPDAVTTSQAARSTRGGICEMDHHEPWWIQPGVHAPAPAQDVHSRGELRRGRTTCTRASAGRASQEVATSVDARREAVWELQTVTPQAARSTRGGIGEIDHDGAWWIRGITGRASLGGATSVDARREAVWELQTVTPQAARSTRGGICEIDHDGAWWIRGITGRASLGEATNVDARREAVWELQTVTPQAARSTRGGIGEIDHDGAWWIRGITGRASLGGATSVDARREAVWELQTVTPQAASVLLGGGVSFVVINTSAYLPATSRGGYSPGYMHLRQRRTCTRWEELRRGRTTCTRASAGRASQEVATSEDARREAVWELQTVTPQAASVSLGGGVSFVVINTSAYLPATGRGGYSPGYMHLRQRRTCTRWEELRRGRTTCTRASAGRASQEVATSEDARREAVWELQTVTPQAARSTRGGICEIDHDGAWWIRGITGRASLGEATNVDARREAVWELQTVTPQAARSTRGGIGEIDQCVAGRRSTSRGGYSPGYMHLRQRRTCTRWEELRRGRTTCTRASTGRASQEVATSEDARREAVWELQTPFAKSYARVQNSDPPGSGLRETGMAVKLESAAAAAKPYSQHSLDTEVESEEIIGREIYEQFKDVVILKQQFFAQYDTLLDRGLLFRWSLLAMQYETVETMLRRRASQWDDLEMGEVPTKPVESSITAIVPASSAQPSKTYSVKRRQLPITPAYAFTDYRARGQTLESVIVDVATPPSGHITARNIRGRETIRILRPFDESILLEPLEEDLKAEDERLEGLNVETTRRHSF